MTKHATPPRGAEAPIWQAPRTEPAVAQDVLEQWQTATARLRAVAQAEGLSRTEVSKRSDVPLGTLSPWYEGTYAGRIDSVTERVLRWLDAHAEQQEARTHIPVSPEFVATPTARRLHEALMHAQAVPEIAVVTMGWAPVGEPGVFVLRSGRMVSMATGTMAYQLDFALPRQLRHHPDEPDPVWAAWVPPPEPEAPEPETPEPEMED